MSTRLSGGSGGGSTEMSSLNLATGEPNANANANEATNLSGSHRPSSMTNELFSQVEYFADEIVLGEIEKHELMGRPITRRMSIAMLCCCCICAISLGLIIGTAIGEGEMQHADISQAEGQKRYKEMFNMLEPLAGETIAEEGTPEQRALYWLAYEDQAQFDPVSHIDLLTQRFVLATLYESTSGDDWDQQYSFMGYKDTCDWHTQEGSNLGAHCNDDGYVDSLILPSQHLNGTLPRDIGLLTHMTRLDLSGNKLWNHLPSSIGILHKLTHLDISDNQFSGFAPNNAQKLTNLQQLKLNKNAFVGEIPFEYLVDLSSIKEIDLSHNRFNGIVHDNQSELWGMLSLERLDLSYNKFEGGIPPFLSQVSSVRFLDLSYNSFTGSIPPVYGHMKNLEELDISKNKLGGSIPLDFGDDVEFSGDRSPLVMFKASSNDLVGRIPSQFGNFVNLGTLVLDDNGLDGTIPTEFGNLAQLQVLDLRQNSLLGPIPSELSGCISLLKINLSNNRLEERIPTEIGTLKVLDMLDLRNNMLVGEIPTELVGCFELKSLLLTGNRFIGDLGTILCDRPSDYPPWSTFESDCLDDLLSCPCCTTCCNDQDFCCRPGTSSCDDA